MKTIINHNIKNPFKYKLTKIQKSTSERVQFNSDQ